MATDIHQQITDRIVAAIENGAGTWTMPWHSGSGSGRPINAATKRAYRGVNTIALWVEQQVNGFTSSRWATFNQWTAIGASVRKGSRAAWSVLYREYETTNGDGEVEGRWVARATPVFNADQVSGYEHHIVGPVIDPIPEALELITATGAEIQRGGDRAFYSPSRDMIVLPEATQFRDQISEATTAFHELAHWTGHKTRLDRDLSGRFGSEAYAIEELIAELASAFVAADLGISTMPRADHAAYVANWLKVLRDDKRAIFSASSHASKAADYLTTFRRPPS